MKKETSFKSLQSLVYIGQLENKQFPTTSFVNYSKLTPTQEMLYNRLLKGLDVYTPQELYKMNSAKKARIFRKQLEAKQTINIWKQELTNKATNDLLKGLFPNSEFISDMIKNTSVSNNYKNTLSFKDLGINKTKLINKLIAEELLPNNFATL